MSIIQINWDFTNGEEVSYVDGIRCMFHEYPFQTNCLEFFCQDNLNFYEDVVVMKEDGSYISVKELLQNTGEYTDKEIRKEHDIRKMLVAGAFNFKKGH